MALTATSSWILVKDALAKKLKGKSKPAAMERNASLVFNQPL